MSSTKRSKKTAKKAPTKTAAKTATAAERTADKAIKSVETATDVVASQNAEALNVMSEVGEQCARLAYERWKSNLETMSALAKCRSPMDAVAVYTHAAELAARDYQHTTERIGAMLSNGWARH